MSVLHQFTRILLFACKPTKEGAVECEMEVMAERRAGQDCPAYGRASRVLRYAPPRGVVDLLLMIASRSRIRSLHLTVVISKTQRDLPVALW